VIDDRMGEVRKTDDGYELAFERRLARPIEKVWAALTVPDRIAEWLTTAEVELRLGGRFILDWEDEGFRMEGVVTALDPPRLIAWTFPHEAHPNSVARWELTPDGDGCRLHLTQTGLHSPHMIDVAAGWHTYLEGLPGAAAELATPWRAERERELALLYRDRLPA
jgi:uncharacterized protein YndB with AHSA1/START domain